MPFTPSKSEQRLPPPYYRGCWHGVSRGFLWSYRQTIGVLILSHFFRPDRALQPEGLHRSRGVALSRFAHCKRFSTAASRRSLGSVSVPVWLTILSDQLPVKSLGEPLPHQQADRAWAQLQMTGPKVPAFYHLTCDKWSYPVLARFSAGCPDSEGRLPMYYSPVCHYPEGSFDLHA